MIIGNPVIMGGGGGTLKWNIATGEIAPPVLTNGLWVETATPLEDFTIIFDSSQPAAPANNTLFFRYYPGYPAAEPIQDQTGIVYDLVACQIYTTAGGWQNVNAYREENGEWVLFSTADWHFYASPGTNVLAKYTQQGQIVWSHDFTGEQNSTNPLAWCLDWVDRVLYVLFNVAANEFFITTLDADTGNVIGKLPESNYYSVYYVAYTPNIKLSPDRKTLWVSTNYYSAAPMSNGTVSIDIQTGESTTYVPELNYMDITASGVVAGVVRTSSNAAQLQKIYPSAGQTAQVTASGTFASWISSNGNYILSTTAAYTDDYYYGNVSAMSNATGSFQNAVSYGGVWLPSGDFVRSSHLGFNFYTVDNTGKLSASPYKTLTISGSPIVQVLKPLPNGSIIGVASTNAVYLIGSDDSITNITSIASTFVEVEPGNLTTFPELFQP